jgi:hypothetical protein
MGSICRYNIESPRRVFVLGVAIHVGLSAFAAFQAVRSTDLALFGWLVLSAICGVLALILTIRRLVFPRVLELTDCAILLPRGYPWPRIVSIPYADIIRIRDCGDSLTVHTGKGGFTIGIFRFEGLQTVKEVISTKTSIALPGVQPATATGFPPRLEVPWGDFPPPLVHWTEPEDWSRYRTRIALADFRLTKELWFFVRCFVVLFCIWLPMGLLHFWCYRLSIVSFPIYSLVNLAVAALFITAIRWIYKGTPVPPSIEISFRDNGITTVLINGQDADWSYRNVVAFSVIDREFQGRVLQILLLKADRYDISLALPDDGVRDRVTQILAEKQVPQVADLKPSWETK